MATNWTIGNSNPSSVDHWVGNDSSAGSAGGGSSNMDRLNGYIGQGTSHSNASTGAAQGGVDAAKGGMKTVSGYVGQANDLAAQSAKVVNSVDQDVSGIRDLAGQMTDKISSLGNSASSIRGYANDLNGIAGNIGATYPGVFMGLGDQLAGRVGAFDRYADQVGGIANQLQPMADKLGGYGDAMWSEGNDLFGAGKKLTEMGLGLYNLDGSSSGIAGELMGLYRQQSPEAAAARARADVQSQNDSAYAQQMRDVARRGGSVSGGNALALQKQYKTALATAAAAAMSRARNAGIDKQESYLKDFAGIADMMIKSGDSYSSTGIAAQNAGVGANKAAADAIGQMGALTKSAADIFGLGNQTLGLAGDQYNRALGAQTAQAGIIRDAAGLEKDAAGVTQAQIAGLNTQGGMLKDAAGIALGQAGALNDSAKTYQQSASVTNQATSNVIGAYNNLSDAEGNAAKYYLDAGYLDIKANTPTGGGGGGGGTLSTGIEYDVGGNVKNYIDPNSGKAYVINGQIVGK